MKIKNQRCGIYGGQYVVFTHYNPKTHQVWSDDLYDYDIEGHKYYGQWVDYDSVAWGWY